MIQATLLTKRYGQLTALDECSLQSHRGEILGLLGPNGAGKTTLLRVLLGFIRPTAGGATIDGLDCYRQSVEAHQRLSYLPGEPRLPRRLTGRQTLDFFCGLRGPLPAGRTDHVLERLDLDSTRVVRQMSTGMRQKLALAIALAAETPLIILDEPTSNLDPTARAGVLQLLRDAKAAGRTVLFSSHVLSEVEEICDRVIMLREGRVVETLAMEAVRKQHRISAELTGPLTLPPGIPPDDLQVTRHESGAVTILTGHSLAPLLSWLATQPLGELHIEPVGLRTVYDRHHLPSER